MRRRDRAVAAALAALTLAVPARALKTEVFAPSGAAAPAAGAPAGRLVTAGQAIMRLSSGTAAESVDPALAALGLRRAQPLGYGFHVVAWDSGRPVASVLTQLQSVPGLSDVEPSNVYTLKRIPSDPLVSSQWALGAVSAYNGWDLETGYSNRVTIAVIDAGIDASQPDLTAKLANTTSQSFDPNCAAVPCAATPNNPPTPACDHATHVAGVAAASSDNHFEVSGMSWGAQLVSLKVFADADCTTSCGDTSAGQCLTNDPAIASAINYATGVANTAAYGKMVVNMSLGGVGACSGTVQTAVTAALNAGIVVVAAAGNDGSAVNAPGDCTGVIPVGATDAGSNIASFSSNGAVLASNGLVAPGVSVLTTDLKSQTALATGTSFASPMVAGAAALIYSAKPTATVTSAQNDIQTFLRAGAVSLGRPANNQGAGLLNLYRSLYDAINGSVPSVPAGPSVTAAGLPGPYAFPNPLRLSQSGRALFFLPPDLQTSALTIKVYTPEGVLVRQLGAPVWDGRNDGGSLVASGSYVFVASNGSKTVRGRVTVIR